MVISFVVSKDSKGQNRVECTIDDQLVAFMEGRNWESVEKDSRGDDLPIARHAEDAFRFIQRMYH